MSTFRQLTYMVLDEVKQVSDDSSFNEDHVIFLLSKYRGFILNQQFANIKRPIAANNYQSVCLKLKPQRYDFCGSYPILKSTVKVPKLMTIGKVSISGTAGFQFGNITYVSNARFKHVGYKRYLKNEIYATIDPMGYLMLRSSNPSFLYLSGVMLTGLFQDPQEAAKLACCDEDGNGCNILDNNFPLEDAYIPTLIQAVVKELIGAAWRPKDDINNANDDLSNISTFIRQNMKKDYDKVIENE